MIQDILKREKVKLIQCKTEQMVGDYFTKPLRGTLLKNLHNYIMVTTVMPYEECVETIGKTKILKEKSGQNNS